MSLDPATAATIFGMAAVTYLTRVTGFWLIGRVQPTGRLAAALEAVPGAILIAVIAPTVLATGPAETLAALVVVLAAWRLPLLAVVVCGVLAAALLRLPLG